MDYILSRIENQLSLMDEGSYDYITYLRTRIEYSLFLCLGVLWENFGKLPAGKQKGIIASLNNLSIGSAVSAIRDLNAVSGQYTIFNKHFGKQIDSYPAIRNTKMGHGYEMAASIASALTPLYHDMFDNSPLLQAPCDMIVIKQYDPAAGNYIGVRFPADKNGQGARWSCPKELITHEETDFPRTYIVYENNYYKISPFVFIDPSAQAPFVFNSLVEKVVGKVRLSSVFPATYGSANQDYCFNELIYMSTSEGDRQISQSNGTIMNNFTLNYNKYIDVGFHKLIEEFLFKNRAYVSATVWGHGGVGKTACIQKTCRDLFNSSKKKFSYIIFITAKDRIYNPKTGQIDSSTGNISLYSEIIKSIATVLFNDVNSTLTDEALSEYEQRISNFEDTLLIVIDDYETFEDSEKEKISNFLSRLDARYHKAIITTRNRRFVIGQPIPCNELDRQGTKKFIQAAIQEQNPAHYADMDRVLKNEDLLARIHEATSGRPIFIYQFIYLFMQKGFQRDLIDGIRNSPNAQEFLYGRIYEYLSKNAQYLFAAISTLTDNDLRFNLNILEHILSKVITENAQFEESLEELENQRVVELAGNIYGRVYSPELLKIMEAQYQKYPQDFQSTVKNLLDGIGGKNIKGSIFEAMLEQADRSRTFGNEKETISKYRHILNSSKVPHTIQKTAIKHLADYLSNSRLDTSSAIIVVEEYLPLFPDDADIYIFYTYLLWSQGVEEKEKAVNVIQGFFSKKSHKKTSPNYLTYFALGVGYIIDFDIRYRGYSKEGLRKAQYNRTFNEYGKLLFKYVQSHPAMKGKPALFHNIRVALVQTAKLCNAMGQDGKNPDAVAYGLKICAWMRQSNVMEPFLGQIVRLQNNLESIASNPVHHDEALSGAVIPNMETGFTDSDDTPDSLWSGGKQYNIGEVVEVVVKRAMSYGVFAALDESTSGLIHISEIADRYIADIDSEFTLGQTYSARIIDIDSAQRIHLSTIEFHP